MLEKLLLIANRLDKLIKIEYDWYNSKTKIGRFLKVSLLFSTFLVCVIMMLAVMSLVLHYLPWLAGCIILVCVTVPLVVIVASFILKRISAVLWGTSMFLSLLLSIFAFWLWLSEVQACNMQFARARLFSNKTQFPLGNLGGIAVDDKGRIYLAVQSYNRIQVYNTNGDFLRGWFFEAGGGDFDIWLGDKNQIHVLKRRTYRHAIYNSHGQLIKSTKIRSDQEYISLHQKASGLKEQDAYGNSYSILSPKWFPKVVKLTSEGEQSVLIKDPFYFWLVKMPHPILLIFATSLIILTVLGKVIKKKVYFPQVDADACSQSLE